MWQHLGWQSQKSFCLPSMWLWIIHEDRDPSSWLVPSKGLGTGGEDSLQESTTAGTAQNCSKLWDLWGW